MLQERMNTQRSKSVDIMSFSRVSTFLTCGVPRHVSGTTLCCLDSEKMPPTDRVRRKEDRKATTEVNLETPT